MLRHICVGEMQHGEKNKSIDNPSAISVCTTGNRTKLFCCPNGLINDCAGCCAMKKT